MAIDILAFHYAIILASASSYLTTTATLKLAPPSFFVLSFYYAAHCEIVVSVCPKQQESKAQAAMIDIQGVSDRARESSNDARGRRNPIGRLRTGQWNASL